MMSSSISRLQLSQMRARARQPRRPKASKVVRFSGGAKPVESTGRMRDRFRSASQTSTLLHSAGIQRPAIELNALRPLVRLSAGSGIWNLLQYAAAYATVDVPIVINALPAYSTEQEVSKILDATCVSVPPVDGAIVAHGRLIVRNPGAEASTVSITSAGSSRSIFWSGRGANPPAPVWTVDLAPHIIDDEQVIEHMFFYDPPRVTLSIPSETLIGPGRIALFDVIKFRAAMSGSTTTLICRMA